MPQVLERDEIGTVPPIPPSPPGGGDPPGGDGDDAYEPSFGISRAHLGMWIFLVTVTALFSALAVAYVFIAITPGWQRIQVPPLVWLNTAVLVASSVTIERARKSISGADMLEFQRWLTITFLLGLVFLLGQAIAWFQLFRAATEPNAHRSFLYILSGVHGAHLIGGIATVLVLLSRTARGLYHPGKLDGVRVCALYWHFMDVIWILLLLLLVLV